MTRYLVLIVLIGVFDFGQSLSAKEDSSRQKNGRLLSVFQVVVRFQVSLFPVNFQCENCFKVVADPYSTLKLSRDTTMMLEQ